MKRRKTAGDVRKVRRSLTTDEVCRLLAVAGPRRLFYSMAVWTGLRVGEATALRWGHVDLEANVR